MQSLSRLFCYDREADGYGPLHDNAATNTEYKYRTMTVPVKLAQQSSVPQSIRLGDANKVVETGLVLGAVSGSIAKAKRILLVTGAGISCNAGIPDFRSEDGLYSMVKKEHPMAVVKGRDLFDAILFSSPVSVSVFCTFMARLRSCILRARSTAVHKFIKLLHDQNRLLRCYTQNIDGLESQDGLRLGVEGKTSEVVQLHGDIHMLKCTMCGLKVSWSNEDFKALEDGAVPECRVCSEKAEERTNAGKRCPRIGGLLPNIVLYGEEHPDGDDIGRSIDSDIKSRPDCLIIVGTSLKVVGVRKLVRKVAKAVHERGGVVIFVNRTAPAVSSWKGIIDYHIESDCDKWVEDLRMRQPNLFLKQSNLPLRPAKEVKKVSYEKKHSVASADSMACNVTNGPSCVLNVSQAPEASIAAGKKRKLANDTESLLGITNLTRPKQLRRTSGLTASEFDKAMTARARQIHETQELENLTILGKKILDTPKDQSRTTNLIVIRRSRLPTAELCVEAARN
ncbi:DHS-like NAD/FAD-binding domain-containing protein [Lipomyces orientalis]|uniref:DHS-like NAD/FAD-binding domain-containing protein n=1 Tax=Lipomyces orientalis TaxID=1233043 RepID=A0ACC3TQN1_9ASCO